MKKPPKAKRARAAAGPPRSAKHKRRAARQDAPPTGERAAAEDTWDGPALDPGPALGIPIVGIGASAGGLEALEAFLRNVPDQSGLAFVVVQHLDPTRKGAMVELLQRACRMSVVEVKENLKVERDRVHVIPPNRDLSILHGALHLLPPASPRGMNLPIDSFFRSLATDQQDRSIGVILSGMGSDGTLGLRAIKEKAGASFVQAPSSAKFDGMPSSAIEAGVADVVAPVEELPARILAYVAHAPRVTTRPSPLAADKAQSALERVIVLLRMHTGNDFSLHKRSTVYRRIERRMGLHQIDRISNYVRYLRENPKEIELLFKELLIGVTSFFRDPPAWERLAELLPDLIAHRRSGSVLRAWVPACSTGEEAYSLAIVFKEALERLKTPKNVLLQVFATDLDRDAIEKARQGVYPSNIAADVSPERLRRYFLQEERGFRVSKDIREMVVFAPQNVITDPPFTRLDILSCRNLLIYLAPELQRKLVPLFHYSLNPGGLLFLGSAEAVGSFSNFFGALDGRMRLYRRLETAPAAPLDFPAAFGAQRTGARAGPGAEPPGEGKPSPNLQALADRVLLQRFSPAGVLVNDGGDILYITGRTGKYLEPAIGKANWNVLAMARDGLRIDLGNAFSRALKENREITVRGARTGSDGDAHSVDITVQRLDEPRELHGTLMVVFADAPSAPEEAIGKGRGSTRQSARLIELERELQRTREEVQTTREEMQTSQEELKSTNEELQSTNEELQSTNEELTTSKEEMQSLNEELQTVNHELQAKVDELSRANNDMKNLLNSTDIATLFLDSGLRVRRFTTQTAKIIKLIPGDAGRPVTDIVSELAYPSLTDDAHEVLRTLVFKERVVTARDGRWFTVRILPYRTIDNVIDGVVITFTDATASKALEAALREQASQLRQMAESLPNLVWGARPDGACDYLSRQWVAYTGVPETEQLGFGWLEQVHPEDREPARDAWKAAVKAGTHFDTELRLRSRDGAYRWHKTRAVPIRNEQGEVVKWYGTHTDVDDLKGRAPRGATAQRLASAPGPGDGPEVA